MVDISETSNDLNSWSNIRKVLRVDFIYTFIRFEARNIAMNVRELSEQEYDPMIQKN